MFLGEFYTMGVMGASGIPLESTETYRTFTRGGCHDRISISAKTPHSTALKIGFRFLSYILEVFDSRGCIPLLPSVCLPYRMFCKRSNCFNFLDRPLLSPFVMRRARV